MTRPNRYIYIKNCKDPGLVHFITLNRRIHFSWPTLVYKICKVDDKGSLFFMVHWFSLSFYQIHKSTTNSIFNNLYRITGAWQKHTVTFKSQTIFFSIIWLSPSFYRNFQLFLLPTPFQVKVNWFDISNQTLCNLHIELSFMKGSQIKID